MRRLSVLLLAGAVGLLLIGAVAARSLGEGAEELLPDLDQAAVGKLELREARRGGERRWLLGFGSAVDNVGVGTLLVTGRRPSTATPTMTVEQTVVRSDGSRRTFQIPGAIRYVRSATHQHWHYLAVERYEIRSLGARVPVRRDHKTGFCLGDRYRARTGLPNQPTIGTLNGECGRNQPGLLEVDEGISVGFGDDYDPSLEGQSIDVTGLPAGRYLLVHRVNTDRSIRESSYANNASSLRFRLSWPRGTSARPGITVERRCSAAADCD
ncbi:MAG: hypothetical protein H0T39_05660 [Actinobacteria bacterium]|nr:hypothetical protein [Actinomycetota bacterium]